MYHVSQLQSHIILLNTIIRYIVMRISLLYYAAILKEVIFLLTKIFLVKLREPYSYMLKLKSILGGNNNYKALIIK